MDKHSSPSCVTSAFALSISPWADGQRGFPRPVESLFFHSAVVFHTFVLCFALLSSLLAAGSTVLREPHCLSALTSSSSSSSFADHRGQSGEQ
ncbi:hypothetical protein AOLI_G00284150 [Acnodon oligacanthus]